MNAISPHWADAPDVRLSVVILNWNNAAETITCLQSLAESDYAAYQVLVVDNNSTDDSVRRIRTAFPDVELLALDENRGYTGGNNAALRMALVRATPWTLVLNNDTIVAPDMLSQLMTAAEAQPDLGIAGPIVYHMAQPHVIQSAGGALDRAWRAAHRGQNQIEPPPVADAVDVDWISGCAILLRTAMLQDVGLFDETFHAYWEEVDLCVRAQKAGWRVALIPAAKLWHSGVQPDYQPQPYVTYYSVRNRFYLLNKNCAPMQAKWAAWTEALRTLASWSLRPKWRHMRSHRDSMLQGITDYLRKRSGMQAH